MTKSIPRSSHQDKCEKLLSMIEGNKMSLLKASQILGIPYVDAKQMLFIFGTPRRKMLLDSRSPIEASRTPTKEFKKTKIAEKGHNMSKRVVKRERSERPNHTHAPNGRYCTQCKCQCCPYAQYPVFYHQMQPMQMPYQSWYHYGVS